MGEFRKLALLAEQDGHLRQKLQQVLKLSKEKWDDARDHAMRAVVADNRMRIWCALVEHHGKAVFTPWFPQQPDNPTQCSYAITCQGTACVCVRVLIQRVSHAGRYADKANMEVGLLFTCRLGNVDLDRPVGAPPLDIWLCFRTRGSSTSQRIKA